MNEKIIWDFFLEKGMTEQGVAGLMGNLFAESGLIPTNLQNTFEKTLGMSDEEYTQAVDSGAYTEEQFLTDGGGYGLAQWTFYSRKQALWQMAQTQCTSIGNLTLQLDFLMLELETAFTGVLYHLKSATDVLTASNSVLKDFEKPADQSEAMQEKRYGYALNYYNLYRKQEEEKTMVKICLDAGHSGSTYNQSTEVSAYYESEMAWKLHLYLKNELEQRGFEVITTRADQNTDLAVYNRGAMAKGCDCFLSLHSNACGTESVDYSVVFRAFDNLNGANEIALKLATAIGELMGNVQTGKIAISKTDSGTEYYGVMRGARAVGCPLYLLLEHSFHTNKNASLWLLDDDNLQKLAVLEADILAEYYGMTTSDTTVDSSNFAPTEDEEEEPEIPEWQLEAVEWAIANGIMAGDGNGNYMLDKALTRGEFVVMLQGYHKKYNS